MGLAGWVLALAADPLGPGSGPWVVEDPAAHGLDADLLAAAAKYIADHSKANSTPTWNSTSSRDCFVVIKDGALVYEHYSSEAYNSTAHPGHSMTKTMGALIAGWAATYGGLDLDADITKAYGVPSPKNYSVTSRQIMSQSLAGDDGPGEAWLYDAGGTAWINHMTRVVPAAAGRTPMQIWREEFQTRLGLSESFSWTNADSVWAHGSYATCRDYARVLQLMLNMGRWKGVAKPMVSVRRLRSNLLPSCCEPSVPHQNMPQGSRVPTLTTRICVCVAG